MFVDRQLIANKFTITTVQGDDMAAVVFSASSAASTWPK